MEKKSSRNFTKLFSKVGIHGQAKDYNIIVMICDIHFETLLYIFRVY